MSKKLFIASSFLLALLLWFLDFDPKPESNTSTGAKMKNSQTQSSMDDVFLRYEVRGTVNAKPGGDKNIVAVFRRGFTLLPDTKENNEPAYNKKSLEERMETLKRQKMNYDAEQLALNNWPDDL